MNGYLMTLSLINQRSFIDNDGNIVAPQIYSTKEGTCFDGRMTNEAPSKYVFFMLAKENLFLDRIMILISDECENRRFDFIDGRNTFEYFFDSLREYLNNHYKVQFPEPYAKIIKNYGDITSYLDAIIVKIPVSSEPESEEKFGIINSITDFIAQDDKNRNLYVDFSGGSRISAMATLTIVRIFEKHFETNIKEVIYANINRDNNTLSNINDYYLSLKALEDNALDFKQNSAYSASALEKIGFRFNSETRRASESAARLKGNSSNAYSQNQKDDIRKAIKEEKRLQIEDPLAREMHRQAIKEIESELEEGPFALMAKKNDEDLIRDFHEAIISILIDFGYIVPVNERNKRFKEDVNKQLKAVEFYYEGNKNYNGVLPGVVNLVKNHDASSDFNGLLEKKMNIQSHYYKNFNPRFVKGINLHYADRYFEYYRSKNIYIEGSEDELVREYYRLMVVYFNYGFPFACSNKDGSAFYDDVQDFYIDRAKAFFNYLEQHKDTDKEEVENVLAEIRKEGVESPTLRKWIPFMVKSSIWKLNESMFVSRKDAEEFLKTLCYRIENVRNYRNALSHLLENKYSDSDLKKKMAVQIREWIKEYDSLCRHK